MMMEEPQFCECFPVQCFILGLAVISDRKREERIEKTQFLVFPEVCSFADFLTLISKHCEIIPGAAC